jgi:cytochrome b subunit of formate dehydrogenase
VSSILPPGPTFVATLCAGGARKACLLAAAAFSLALAAPAIVHAQAEVQAIPNDRCFGCHDDESLVRPDGNSMAVSETEFGASKHRRLECTTCHADALTTRHPRNNLGPVSVATCEGCHAESIATFRGSVHATRAHLDDDAANCGKCHGNLHTLPRRAGLEAPLGPINQMETCGQCHQDMMEGYLHSSHAKARLVKGLNSAPSCTDCHGTHNVLSKENDESRTSRDRSPETCGRCHEFILVKWRDKGAHGKLWMEGNTRGPICIDCHRAHDVQDPTSLAMRRHFPGECGNCHVKYNETYSDSFHGQATELGRRAAAMCADCHTPHESLAQQDPASTIHPDNLSVTCGRCHTGTLSKGFLSFDPHNDPTDAADNRYVHWTYVAMVALLLGVFGFFSLHLLLWLQRIVVGKLRGEIKATRHGGPGQYVRRFSRSQVFTHVTVVVSFLLLAATGLPLKFSAEPWAKELASLLGGQEVTGFLHRLAAIVTFGYFGFHVVKTLIKSFSRQHRDMLWGPRSLVPQPVDLADLWFNLRYFLYLGPQPKFGRWTYWEKFDYMAVFWGVAVIGVSGLMLWLPGLFTSFLPGWMLNVAWIIHAEEALLATGFIFLFHFFHTHLRPESFPLDPVIFLGKMPLERFKEERPLEYRQLVETGRLESLLEDPPTEGQVRRAYIFGFTALTIGLVLAVFIFTALLKGILG